MKIYLAGGMRSDWRDRLILEVNSSLKNSFIANFKSNIQWIDPTEHNYEFEKGYTSWDLFAIERSDVVIIHTEVENPAGFNMFLEAGYALALGKYVIFWEEPDDPRSNYYGMLRSRCNQYANSIDSVKRHIVEIVRIE